MSGPSGKAFKGKTGPLGLARMKSANTTESPTGYRSRGPSAERHARVLRRRAEKVAPQGRVHVTATCRTN
jgi:hypothetical protein